ncbi:MAG: hypothetical protein J7K87_00355 [Candidatus Aenigmarchaeota archaeon]|nr:hypothetical protein [Candidatus Aenigmarchaeota archaeon]
MNLMKKLGMKALITDIDGPLGNCEKAAYNISQEVGDLYSRAKNNPSLLQDVTYDMDFENVMQKLVWEFDIHPGVVDTLKKTRRIGYVNFAITDNPIFGPEVNRIIFEQRLDNGIKEIHPTIIPRVVGGKIVFENNGPKNEYIDDKFRIYESGVLIVDDKNDLEAAEHAKKLRNEEGYEIKIIKVGNNCRELDKHVDYIMSNFNEILNIV